MAKITKEGNIGFEHKDYNWSTGVLELHAARNETVAYQLILKRATDDTVTNITLSFGEFRASDTGSTTQFYQSAYAAFYHPIDNAGYTWGPPTPVLAWPAEYPDALVPFTETCASDASGQVLKQVDIASPKLVEQNQAIWIDTYIPKNTAPGIYEQILDLEIDEHVIQLPVQITVYNTTLPDEPSIDAVGEIYRSYDLEGAGFDITDPAWKAMSHCYQRLAHQHRMVFIERLPTLLTQNQLDAYADVIEPIVTGSLFDVANGYIGPGENTPVSIWKTPWPQTINGFSVEPLSEREISEYASLASNWNALSTNRGWPTINYFAYVFDEVDGPDTTSDTGDARSRYIEQIHDQISLVQNAIDSGTTDIAIDLIWTSHSNPSAWKDDPALDLTDKVRLWAPNASAADTQFLSERIASGDKAWFYHSGHPAVGAHSINVSGIEMRTWGVIGARYGFQGQLMWALNLGSDDFPYREPHYRPDEDRAGNGVMVYPGNQLDKIGFKKSPGPVPSMRLKAWRRGLQDAELYYLAFEQSPETATQLITGMVPTALSEGEGRASWPSTSGPWIEFHKQLLQAASTR